MYLSYELDEFFSQEKTIALGLGLSATSSGVDFRTETRSHVGVYDVTRPATGVYRVYLGEDADNVRRYKHLLRFCLMYYYFTETSQDTTYFTLTPVITNDNSAGEDPFIEFTCYSLSVGGSDAEPTVSFTPVNLAPVGPLSGPVTTIIMVFGV